MTYTITESAKEYHGHAECLSSHKLRDFRHSPLYFYRKHVLGVVPDETSRTMEFGTAFHALVLEPKEFFNRYLIADGPINPKTGDPYGATSQKYQEWRAEQSKDIISTNEYQLLCVMGDAVDAHKGAYSLLQGAQTEVTLRGQISDTITAQARIDAYQNKDGIITDLKTTSDIDGFERDVARYGYLYQVAFYRMMARKFDPTASETIQCYWIVAEKFEPFRVGVWRIADASLDAATHANTIQIEMLESCYRTEHWPSGYEKIRNYVQWKENAA